MEQLLNNYERYHNELEADLYLLQMMLQQDRPEPSGNTIELGVILNYLKGCADFVHDEVIDLRLNHAELRFRQLSYLDWMIKSRPQEEQEVIQALWFEKLSLAEAADKFYISKTSMHRRKQEILSSLEAFYQSNKTMQELWNEME